MEGESGEQVGGELESVTSSAGCFVRQEDDSRDEVMHSETSDW